MMRMKKEASCQCANKPHTNYPGWNMKFKRARAICTICAKDTAISAPTPGHFTTISKSESQVEISSCFVAMSQTLSPSFYILHKQNTHKAGFLLFRRASYLPPRLSRRRRTSTICVTQSYRRYPNLPIVQSHKFQYCSTYMYMPRVHRKPPDTRRQVRCAKS
uniref:Uncharacterized protein n=1 Tax=Lutzomyia longipalpis TaxID=7200 RepID=A0A1B0C922_LUTLO